MRAPTTTSKLYEHKVRNIFLSASCLVMTSLTSISALGSDGKYDIYERNPYISACENVSDAEFKIACIDAANGTVIILRNPNEVSDIVRDGFSSAVSGRYDEKIPVEFRDTNGPTTVFLFDKHMQVDRDMLANGSLLYVLGKKYPEKAIALGIPRNAPQR